MITDILIEEGESVKKGQVLFVIDQTPYKAAYEIAVANVKSADAALSTAQLILKSNKDLYEQDVVSEFDLMTAQNALIEAAVANATMEIPEPMIEEQVNYILRDMEYRMMYQGLRMEVPRYITPTLSEMNLTTERSCEMKR